jgi:hypothetical protein
MRLHLFEFEDFAWFPDVIRTGGTDYLRYFLIRTALYQPAISLINQTLSTTGEHTIIDLCSGGGGYTEQVCEGLTALGNTSFTITLTDKYPNQKAFEYLKEKSNGRIDYCDFPVDVFRVPEALKGLRVLFSAVHHFRPAQVKEILQNAVAAKTPVAFFDGGEKGIPAILGLLIIHPIAFLLCTPFFRPFKLSRIFFTYIVPLIPLYTIWDGIVSVLRMYTPKELRQIAESVTDDYVWLHGKTKNRFGIKATYLIGYPKNES